MDLHSVSVYNVACTVLFNACEPDLFDLRPEMLTQLMSVTLLLYS